MSRPAESRPSSPSPFFIPALRDAVGDFYRKRDTSPVSASLRILAGVDTDVSMWMANHGQDIEVVLAGVDRAIVHREDVYFGRPFEDAFRANKDPEKLYYKTTPIETPAPLETIKFLLPQALEKLLDGNDRTTAGYFLEKFLRGFRGFGNTSQVQVDYGVGDRWRLGVYLDGDKDRMPKISLFISPQRTDDLWEREVELNRQVEIKKLSALDRAKIEDTIEYVRSEGDLGVGSVPLGVCNQDVAPVTFEEVRTALTRSYWTLIEDEELLINFSTDFAMDPDSQGKRAVFLPEGEAPYLILVEEVYDRDDLISVDVSARIAHDERSRQVSRRLLTGPTKGG